MDAGATTATRPRATGRQMLNKVPEVTVWFWIIKILCTTVGESFADYINNTLGFGLTNTMLLFTAVFVVVLAVQMRAKRYIPFPYWLTVVVVVTIQPVAGIQTLPLVNSVRTSKGRRPCLAAVAR